MIYPQTWLTRARENTGRKYFGCVPEPGEPGACQNCQGITFVYMFVSGSGPHSEPTTLKKGDSCHYVEGQGWYYGHFEAEPCPVCSSHERRNNLIKVSRLVNGQLDVRIDQYKPMPGKEEARATTIKLLEKLPEAAGYVTYFGDVGRGKTHLLLSVVNGYRIGNIPAVYITAADLLNEIRETYDQGNDGSAAEVIRAYAGYPVLAIDELNPDNLNVTPWAREQLQTILDKRFTFRNRQLTLIATKSNPRYLAQTWGDAWAHLSSRMQAGLIVEVGGADVRPAQGIRVQNEF